MRTRESKQTGKQQPNRDSFELLLNLAYGEIYRRLPPCQGLRAAWVKTWLRDARKFETN